MTYLIKQLVSRGSRFISKRNSGSALLAMLLFGIGAGMSGLLGISSTMEATSTTEFCIGCHEMQVLYEELAATPHARNRSGIQVTCADCHIPKNQPDKLIAKILAVDDIYAHFIGTIDTPEKFEDKRLEMAQKVWSSMIESGSQNCRNCHSFDAMELSKQSSRPAYKHRQAMESGETCVECHKGVAHKLPKDFRNDD